MRKATKRKRYYALMNPIELAISGACKTTEVDLDKLRLAELSAIESFAKGDATQSDFRTVADMLNLCEQMALKSVGDYDAIATVQAAHAVLVEAQDRFVRVGRLATTGPGLTVLRELYAYHDAQRSCISRSEYERFIVHTTNLIRSRHPSLKRL